MHESENAMFGRKSTATLEPPPENLRDTLFGDLPLEVWPREQLAAMHEPWKTFAKARWAAEDRNIDRAITLWQALTERPLESRHKLQAWHFLRQHDVRPSPERAKKLLGVVLEVPMDGGLDLLAAYADCSARYYNFSGAGVVWDHPNLLLDPQIDALLEAGQKILNLLNPWIGERPLPPPRGQIRINFLSPAGLHFGQASMDAMMKDALGRSVVNAGVALMNALIEQDPRVKP